MISIALSVFAALINLPSREEAVPRLRAAVNPA
jgi:hypothetical protein